MNYWLISIAIIIIIIIIACLIYYNNTVIEGLGENPMTKYYEDTSRIDNMIRMITMKITELRLTLPNSYISILTPENMDELDNQRTKALEDIKSAETRMDEETTQDKKDEEKKNIDALNQKVDEITDAKSIIRYQSQIDYLNNAKKIATNKYDIYYYKNKVELIQKELDDETNNLSDTEKKEKQTEIDNYNRNIQNAESTITKLEGENKAKLDTDKDIYLPLQNIIDGKSESSGSDPATTYDIPVDEAGNIDPTQFYDYIDEEAIIAEAEERAKGVAYVKDASGNMVALPDQDKLFGSIHYYEPGSYKYDSGIYVPSYQDSIYLSKTTGQYTASEYLDMASLAGGICTHYKDQPEKLEEECAKLDKNICGSTSCCALLGGSKCVAGNAQGPISKLNYGDVTIRNRDFYYYKGKCYGNCVSRSTTTVDNTTSNEESDARQPIATTNIATMFTPSSAETDTQQPTDTKNIATEFTE